MKKPTKKELLSAALTVLRLGAPKGSPLAKIAGPKPRVSTPLDPKWKDVIHTCSKCGRTGPVDPMFGVRTVRGKEYLTGWCRECRSSTNYHNKPRKYRTRNGGPE